MRLCVLGVRLGFSQRRQVAKDLKENLVWLASDEWLDLGERFFD